jgi:hypothetical protein
MIIDGISSGDLECWCFLVTKETFESVTGKKPDRRWDVGRFAKKGSLYRYMLYPGHLIGHDEKGILVTLSVEAVPVGKRLK